MPRGDGQEVGEHAHFEDARGQLKNLDRHGGRAHGGQHDGKKLLLFKAVAQGFVTRAVDAFEQEELAAGAAQVVGQHAADGRSDGRHQAVKQHLFVVCDAVAHDQRIEKGQGDGG